MIKLNEINEDNLRAALQNRVETCDFFLSRKFHLVTCVCKTYILGVNRHYARRTPLTEIIRLASRDSVSLPSKLPSACIYTPLSLHEIGRLNTAVFASIEMPVLFPLDSRSCRIRSDNDKYTRRRDATR